jgi:hypoxanthine phosphoribosyltransferase
VQALHYSRFEGFSRLFNWFYSREEEELEALERRAVELIDGTKAYIAREVLGVSTARGEITALESELRRVRDAHYREADYDRARRQLQSIIERGDRLSSRLAQMDMLGTQFGRSQVTAVTPAEAVRQLRALAERGRITDLGAMRELVDMLTQWLSDTLIKVKPLERTAVVIAKARLAEASLGIHQAFYVGAALRQDETARQLFLHACGTVMTIDFARVPGEDLAKIKQREDRESFDPGAMSVAAAMIEDGFVPHLVVGLPTGGAHAANRVAAAIAIRTGQRPVLWFTRPQGAKEESRKFMEEVPSEAILGADELDLLSRRVAGLPGARQRLRIAIIDDGAVSGATMERAREIYAEAFHSLAVEVVVRTATVRGGNASEFEILPRGQPNRVDYVMNLTTARVGPPAVLRVSDRVAAPIAPDDEEPSPEFGLRRLNQPVVVHSTEAPARQAPLRATLLPAN